MIHHKTVRTHQKMCKRQDIQILSLLPHTTLFLLSFPSRSLFPHFMTQIMPIYELVTISTAAEHAGSRLANLQRAWDEYLQQFDPCRCAPCRYNGIPVLSGTSCTCICKSGFEGKACETTLRKGEAFVITVTELSYLSIKT